MDAAGAGCGDAQSSFDFVDGKFQQAGTGDGGAEAAEDRRAVKAAVLDVGRIGGDFTDHFDAEHVGFEQVFAGSADMFRQTAALRRQSYSTDDRHG